MPLERALQIRMDPGEVLPADSEEKSKRLLLLEQLDLLRRAQSLLPVSVPGPMPAPGLAQAPGGLGNGGTFPAPQMMPLLSALLGQAFQDPNMLGGAQVATGTQGGGPGGGGSLGRPGGPPGGL